jgi:hypothetical protein
LVPLCRWLSSHVYKIERHLKMGLSFWENFWT